MTTVVPPVAQALLAAQALPPVAQVPQAQLQAQAQAQAQLQAQAQAQLQAQAQAVVMISAQSPVCGMLRKMLMASKMFFTLRFLRMET